MKKIPALFYYALFLLLGHSGNSVNAQTVLNPVDFKDMKDGIELARCDYDSVANPEVLRNIRDALNNY